MKDAYMMNERIRELAERAAEYTRVKYDNAYWRMQDEFTEDLYWREKFAELIVKECFKIAYECGPTLAYGSERMVDPVSYIGDQILIHFEMDEK